MSGAAVEQPENEHVCVLIVDDDDEIREVLGEILHDEGYATAGAANGAEALDYLTAHPHPCLILLDLMMPVMNGLEFRREQVKDPTLSKIPVIVVSAADDCAKRAAQLGVSRCLRKPVSMSDLLVSVQQHC